MIDKAKFVEVNVDQSADIASKYNICNMPAMLILKNGEEQEIMVVFLPKEVRHNQKITSQYASHLGYVIFDYAL